jgi:hypothetical protein
MRRMARVIWLHQAALHSVHQKKQNIGSVHRGMCTVKGWCAQWETGSVLAQAEGGQYAKCREECDYAKYPLVGR